MTRVAVIAHQGKTLDGGLAELRAALADAGVSEPIWHEVPKSRKAPKRVRRALEEGADLVFVWGGDGMVQRCADVLAGTSVDMAILPAGTANLFASNLGIPKDLAGAVEAGLHGATRRLDLGVVNGERFAVMAGSGFDARMIRDADKRAKRRLGRAAYIRSAAKATGEPSIDAKVKVDGETWFTGRLSCVLVGNVGTVTGGLTVFSDARPDDGWLDVGVVTATGALEWLRVLGRLATGHGDRSPLTRTTRGRTIEIKLKRKVPYELDGGDRPSAAKLTVHVDPGALSIRVPT